MNNLIESTIRKGSAVFVPWSDIALALESGNEQRAVGYCIRAREQERLILLQQREEVDAEKVKCQTMISDLQNQIDTIIRTSHAHLSSSQDRLSDLVSSVDRINHKIYIIFLFSFFE